MSNKFEQLLDFLVNEETDKANELFHEIVVEKSREIYENLIAEEAEEEAKKEEETKEEAESDDESMEEAADDQEEDESVEESYSEMEEVFGTPEDETDDFEKDTVDHDAMDADGAEDEFGGEEGGEEAATKDDVLDLKDALEELKAEFEALMSAEKNEEEKEPGIHDDEEGNDPLDSVEDDEEEGEEEEEEGKGNPFAESKAPKSQGEKMREYIEKVTATMDGGLAGARTGETVPAPKEGKSPISSGSGKPTSGANASNIATDTKTHDEDGTAPKGKVGGLVKKGADVPHAGQFLNTEKSGQKAKGMFAQAKKPASGEGKPVGAGTGQSNVTGATNTKSIESGK